MSRRSKLVLSVILSLSLLPVAVQADIISPNKIIKNLTLEKYINKDEKEVKGNLKQLSKKQIIDEVNSIAASLETTNYNNELIPFVEVLFQRKDEFEDTEIIEIIKDNANSITTQEIMVDLYTVKHENKLYEEDLKKLLKENIRNEIKAKIVINSKFTGNDGELLKSLIEEDEGSLAFNSLKKLSKTDVKEAYKISKEILSNYKSQSKQKVSAAQKATVQYLKSNKSNNNDLKNNFISLCLEIYNTSDDDLLKDSSIFALSDLMDKESIIKVINNENIDKELKVFAVDQNFMTLNEVLLNSPTQEDIEIVVKAMEIMPIVDLVEPLEEVKKYISDSNLQKRCDDVIKNMILNGHKGNIKWLDKNNN